MATTAHGLPLAHQARFVLEAAIFKDSSSSAAGSCWARRKRMGGLDVHLSETHQKCHGLSYRRRTVCAPVLDHCPGCHHHAFGTADVAMAATALDP